MGRLLGRLLVLQVKSLFPIWSIDTLQCYCESSPFGYGASYYGKEEEGEATSD
jgi:hypothetical protein